MSLPLMFSTHASVAKAHAPRQITTAPHNHILTNVAAWSPDSRWLVYDTRSPAGGFDGTRIERVQVDTGEVETLYTAPAGSHCGVVTWSPAAQRLRLVFIQGPEPETKDWSYALTRRRGVTLELRGAAGEGAPLARPLDAVTYAPPFVPGALRGGSHVHVFSGDGRWVSFTYEDNILTDLDAAGSTAPSHDPNQRNIGVSIPAGPVVVPDSHPRNHDGDWFTVLVSRTAAQPQPGSDEISRAFEEGWIGTDGYLRADGTRQSKALAFQGLVTAKNGTTHAEVFLLDLPNDLTVAGDAPLQGTPTHAPSPPRGVVQRRLTFTDSRAYPGVAATPRHWLRSSPDGEHIAFLMKDAAGVVQFWLISPRGGEPSQLTRSAHDIASAFTWSPDGRRLGAVIEGSVCMVDARSGAINRLTPRSEGAMAPLPDACVFSPDGSQLAWQQPVEDAHGRHVQIFTQDVPENF